MAAKFIYGNVSGEDIEAHDSAVLKTQLVLLEKMRSNNTSGAIRDYAEAFALISGLVQEPSTQIKK